MKQTLIKFLALALLVASCGEKPLPEGHYRINGTVTGLDNGEIYLAVEYPKMDTIKVENKTFTIEKPIKDSVGQIRFIKDPNERGMTKEGFFSLFIEPTIMHLNLDYKDFSKSKLTGSPTQDDQYKLDGIRHEISKDYKKEQNHFDAIWKKYNDASKAGASEETLNAINYEIDDAKTKLEPMKKAQSEATVQFIKDHPKSFVSLQSLVFQLNDMSYNEAKAIYDNFSPTHKKTELGKELFDSIENLKKGKPGTLAADFSTTDINGNPLKLSDFKGKYLLIDFWASWCVPCRKGNPHLISLYNKYNPKGLEILGVSDDDRTEDQWRKAIEKDGIGIWHHVLRGFKIDMSEGKYEVLDKGISDGYNIHSLPTKILVDPNGTIVGRYGGGGGTDEDMDKDLAAIFEK